MKWIWRTRSPNPLSFFHTLSATRYSSSSSELSFGVPLLNLDTSLFDWFVFVDLDILDWSFGWVWCENLSNFLNFSRFLLWRVACQVDLQDGIFMASVPWKVQLTDAFFLLRFRFALRVCCLCFRFGFCLKLVILEFAGLESGVWEFLFRVYFWFILRSCFLGFGNNFYWLFVGLEFDGYLCFSYAILTYASRILRMICCFNWEFCFCFFFLLIWLILFIKVNCISIIDKGKS